MNVATGAFLNAIGILAGALFGLAQRAPPSARVQDFLRRALGAATAFFGLRLVWLNVNGTFWPCARQILIALLAIVLGNLAGKILSLQKISNRLGRIAGNRIAARQSTAPQRAGDGFLACTVLFCAAPLGLLGAVTDGLAGDFYLLAVKAVMDGLAMVTFVKLFRWPVALTAVPVFLFLNGLALSLHYGIQPWLDANDLTGSINVAAGFVTCLVPLVIFEVRRVELNSYLPAIFIAPLLKFWLG